MDNALTVKVINLHRLPEPDARRLLGFADIVVNETIVIKGIRIVKGTMAVFVSMPVTHPHDRQWNEKFRLLDNQLQKQIESVVLDAYHNAG